MMSARPLSDEGAAGPGGPPPGPGPSSPPPGPPAGSGGPFGGGGHDPNQVLATVSANPTARPGEPITAGNPTAALGAGFKLDVLRHVASLPFAGPEIMQLVQKAYNEANYGNNAQVY